MHKIVVLDGYTLNPGDLSWAELEAMGEVRIYYRTEEKDVVKRVGDCDIVLPIRALIRVEALEACRSVGDVGGMGGG